MMWIEKTSRLATGFQVCKCVNGSNHLFDESDLLDDESDEEDDDEEDDDDLESLEEEGSLLLSLFFLLDSEDFSLLSFLESLDSDADVNRDAPFEEDRLSVT